MTVSYVLRSSFTGVDSLIGLHSGMVLSHNTRTKCCATCEAGSRNGYPESSKAMDPRCAGRASSVCFRTWCTSCSALQESQRRCEVGLTEESPSISFWQSRDTITEIGGLSGSHFFSCFIVIFSVWERISI